MKALFFVTGFIAGIFATAATFLAAEVVRVYRTSIDSDPWNEFSSEDQEITVEVYSHKPITTDEIKPFLTNDQWTTIDELNQERLAKQEFYTREEVETDETENDDL